MSARVYGKKEEGGLSGYLNFNQQKKKKIPKLIRTTWRCLRWDESCLCTA